MTKRLRSTTGSHPARPLFPLVMPSVKEKGPMGARQKLQEVLAAGQDLLHFARA